MLPINEKPAFFHILPRSFSTTRFVGMWPVPLDQQVALTETADVSTSVSRITNDHFIANAKLDTHYTTTVSIAKDRPIAVMYELTWSLS